MAEIMVGNVAVRIGSARLADIIDLRHVVLRQGLGREAAIFEGDEAPTSLHFAAFTDGKCVGCATFHLNEWEGRPAYQLRGMATAAEFRSGGVWAGLLELAGDTLWGVGAGRQLLGQALPPGVGFFLRAGTE